MPGRLIPLVNDQIYHIFNRGIDRRPTFTDKREYSRAEKTLYFYRLSKAPMSLSRFLRLEGKRKSDVIRVLEQGEKAVEILSYCLMPNHFHFLIRQLKDGGISKFLGNFQNSYTRYFNIKNKRDGSLFLDQFKAKRVETDEQLIHVSRYIHLNPFTGYIVKSLEILEKYLWSSFSEYLNENSKICEIKPVLSYFKTSEEYKKFVFDQADYQRKLKEIEHLLLENP